MFQQDCVVTNDTLNKLLIYIDTRSPMLTYGDGEMLKITVRNCNRKMYNFFFRDIAGPNVTDEQIHKKADELVDTIILEDAKEEIQSAQCDPQRVREFLHAWIEELDKLYQSSDQ